MVVKYDYPYTVDNPINIFNDDMELAEQWLRSEIGKRGEDWVFYGGIYLWAFKHERDAVAFKLRWL